MMRIDQSYFKGDEPFPLEAGAPASVVTMTEEGYHNTRAISSSYLRAVVDGTPHHALHSVATTDAMRIGIGFECLLQDATQRFSSFDRDGRMRFWSLYEDHRLLSVAQEFLRRCAVKPLDLNKGTGARARAAEFAQASEGKTLLSQQQALTCVKMVKASLLNSGFKKHLLHPNGEWQTAIFWWESELPMKALLDFHYSDSSGRFHALDVKTVNGTVSKAHAHDFASKAANLSYDVQAAHYMTALAQLHGVDSVSPFRWLVVEQSRPHSTACYIGSEAMCESGFAQRRRAIKRLREYTESHPRLPEFPTYSEVDVEIDPPRWHHSRFNLGDANEK